MWRTGSLVRVPERHLAVRVRAVRDLRPGLELPCRCALVGSNVGRVARSARLAGNGARPFVPAVSAAALSVRPPNEDGREGDHDQEARDEQPDDVGERECGRSTAIGHARSTTTGGPSTAAGSVTAGSATSRGNSGCRRTSARAPGSAVHCIAASSGTARCPSSEPLLWRSLEPPAAVVGPGAGSEQKRNRRHAATHVGGSRKNRTFLPPWKERALYSTGISIGRIRAARASLPAPSRSRSGRRRTRRPRCTRSGRPCTS